jgi:tetratricopeptide (TPR) repeat protein
MSVSLTTLSRPAFQSMTQGLQAIERYYQERSIADIERAAVRIDDALKNDADYGLAIFYKGVVLDLIGKPADAPQYLERILNECKSPELKIETIFNLGVVNYHRYSHRYLALAKDYFDKVIASAADASLRSMARAHLAQTHAMWMRPSHNQLADKRQPATPEVRRHIQMHFDECLKLVGELRREKDMANRVVATRENANGMAQMYYTDHMGLDSDSKRNHIEAARASLQQADAQLPRDWANTCDLGSLELRWGVFRRQEPQEGDLGETHFEESRERLESVITTLRPDYGFALYEMGILHRVWEKWSEAHTYLQRALHVPVQYRDISDSEVREQLGRVAEQDRSYP